MKRIMYVRANGIYSDSRATKEISSFLKAGYHVLIVGWDREGNSIAKCQEVFFHYLDHVEFCFYHEQVKDHVGFKNISKLFTWLRHVADVLKREQKNLHILHACNLDTCLFCYKLCKKYKIKLVYDIFDYYVDGHESVPFFMKWMIERMEINIINQSDITIICTEERREQIRKAHPQKVIVIHNTPEVEFLQNEIEYDYFYCGTFCIRRLLEETLSAYPKHKELKIGFAGYGIYKDRVTALDKKYKNFHYLGQVKYSECLFYESKSICLSAIYEPTVRNHRLCAPNKFYESLALGKPVIVCRGTGIDQIVEQNKIGIVIDYDVEQLYEAIEKLKNNPSLCHEMGVRARNLYEQKYSWKIMEEILLSAYRRLNQQELF